MQVVESWIERGVSALADAPSILFDPAQRVYWPFLVTSILVAAAVARLARKQDPSSADAPSITSKRLWLHPSSLVDLKLIAAKAVIRALIFAPLLVSALTIAAFVFDKLTLRLGPAEPTALARWQVMALYTVTLFLAWDASRYALHRLVHRVPFLWELHKVHHSAEVLTPFTNYRTHPVESFLYALRGAAVTGVVTGAFFYKFQAETIQYEIIGVNAIGLVFSAAVANLRHSHVWIGYGKFLEHFLISPAQHQLHHSLDSKDFGTNYGSFLAVWDWFFSTLRLAGPRRNIRVGIPKSDLNHDPANALSCLISPVASSLSTIIPKPPSPPVAATPPKPVSSQ